MKIAFINPNTYSDHPRPPLGLLSVATVCKSAGHDVILIDANARNLTPEQVAKLCLDADVIGITAMTTTIQEAFKIADEVSNSEKERTIILGGVHASTFPEECADTGMFDVVVVGEGENVILEILKNIKDFTDNPRVNAHIVAGDKPVDLNIIPLPDYSLLDLSKYDARPPHAERKPWTIASTSRGCPFKRNGGCSFCVGSVSGSNFHGMDSGRMFQFVATLISNHGIKDITFYDDIFTVDKKRVRGFCNLVMANKADITWTCESRVTLADELSLEQMATGGCRLIYYGIESGSQGILDRLCKGITLEQVRKAVTLTKQTGIKAVGYFMLGCPGETPETIAETIGFAQDIGLDHAQFSICSPLPGSQLYDEYIKLGYPVPSWSDFRYLGGNGSKPMFTSEALSREDIENAVKEANEIYTKVRA